MRFRILFVFASIFLMAFAAAAQDATPEMTPEAALDPWPELTLVLEPGLMPEGIEYDPTRDLMLIGSLSQGTIHHVDRDGVHTPFITSENLVASVGLEVDEERGRVLAAVLGEGRQGAALGIYDLETGEELAFVDLASLTPDAAGHFTNDVAVDDDGNAYLSDSAAGVFYRVTPEGEASIFLADESFVGQFVINGLAYHPNGYLIAVRGGELIKIPVDDPAAWTEVESQDSFAGGDGLVFLNPTTLVVVRSNGVLRAESMDDWQSASVTGTFEPMPETATTGAVRGDEVFIVYANFSNPQADAYPIQKVIFEE